MENAIEAKEPLASRGSEQAATKMLAETDEHKTGHVTGIGGVFFQSHGDQKVLTDWYEKNLGINIIHSKDEDYGLLKWSDDKGKDGGSTAWRTTKDTADWFGPSKSDFMIDYRVDNMDKIYERIKENKTQMCTETSNVPPCIVEGPKSYSYGKFLWVLDPDGNKVELWEPRQPSGKNDK